MRIPAALAALTCTAAVLAPLPARAAEPACLPVPGAVCGSIRVPLIRSRPDLGSTTVGYALVRRKNTSRPAAGTIAFNPGGPGGSTVNMAAQYTELYADLLNDHDFLLVDPRGVNRSGALDCGITGFPATTSAMIRDAERCGRALGERSRGYTSAETADDLDAVRAKLGLDKLVLKGESYGTNLMTVYAQRHPTRVQSAVLSSAYPLDRDTWFASNARALRRSVRLLCEPGGCDSRRVLADLGRLAARLRVRPIEYRVDGERWVVDDVVLAGLVYVSAANIPSLLGQVPRMVAEALRGDPAKLVALARQAKRPSGNGEEPFNHGLSHAVPCNDYRWAWDFSASFADRERQFERARAKLPAKDFRPFGVRTWTTALRSGNCLRWPDTNPPRPRLGGPLPVVPVLVTSGVMDTNTTLEQGRQAAAQYPRSTFVAVPHLGHLPEREPSGCVVRMHTHFIRTGTPGDLSCLDRIPAVPVS
ncbi:alpha/beta fold hydrolase [Nonomuraea sp. NPDC050328]|uniref:alpha/beta fold hydrolase n=1 Tax=Nonomuraea sp. NPDC050328 TaxID=3364361 RepID=UPI003788D999